MKSSKDDPPEVNEESMMNSKLIEEIREGNIKEMSDGNIDLELENEPTRIITKEVILKRNKMNIYSKEEVKN
jgi:hypothetical protein